MVEIEDHKFVQFYGHYSYMMGVLTETEEYSDYLDHANNTLQDVVDDVEKMELE